MEDQNGNAGMNTDLGWSDTQPLFQAGNKINSLLTLSGIVIT